MVSGRVPTLRHGPRDGNLPGGCASAWLRKAACMQEIAVAIVDDTDLSATDKLAASLDRAGFWTVVGNAAAERGAAACRVVIKPELSGYAIGSPTVTDPAFVEYMIDLLHDRGFTDVSIVGTTDSSALWAENRDLIALSDLLGYRFVTPKGRSYNIVDLAEDIDSAIFPVDTALHGCGLSRSWYEAEVRIVFTKNRTDEAAGYALCLDTLISVLPLADKDLHYRRRRHPGDVVTALTLGGAGGFLPDRRRRQCARRRWTSRAQSDRHQYDRGNAGCRSRRYCGGPEDGYRSRGIADICSCSHRASVATPIFRGGVAWSVPRLAECPDAVDACHPRSGECRGA